MVKKFLAIAVPLIIILSAVAVVVAYMPKEPEQSLVSQSEQLPVTQEVIDIQPAIGANLVYAEGNVQYKNAESDWQAAGEQEVSLYESYSVKVVGTGKAIINLDEGSAVRLNSDSQITLTSLNPQSIVIANDQGEVYNRVITADRDFQVVANETVFESMGTAYNTLCKEKQVGVEVYHNTVKVKEKDQDVLVAEGKKYFVKNEENSDLEKKVADLDKEEVEGDDFIKWNKEQDAHNFSDELGFLAGDSDLDDNRENIGEENSTSGLTLSAVKVDNGIKFSWTVSGIEITQGYKIVKSTGQNPVFPGDSYKYINNPDQKAYTWEIMDGQTYYFRICQYLGGQCGIYSNNVNITAPAKPASAKTETQTENSASGVESIAMTNVGNGTMSWIANGYSAQGFKLVWSKNSGPTYPCRSGDQYLYYSSPNATSGTITAFDGAGTYYVRVCEYLGGKCGVYSNQVTVDLEAVAKETSTKTTETTTVAVSSISLSGSGSSVIWSVNGYSNKGFKIVWSKNSGPTYPCRSGDKYIYLSDPQASTISLKAFDGAGTYYVRVCEYLGGKCGVYSNQIQIDL